VTVLVLFCIIINILKYHFEYSTYLWEGKELLAHISSFIYSYSSCINTKCKGLLAKLLTSSFASVLTTIPMVEIKVRNWSAIFVKIGHFVGYWLPSHWKCTVKMTNQNGFWLAKCWNWLENGQWPTVISSTAISDHIGVVGSHRVVGFWFTQTEHSQTVPCEASLSCRYH